MARRILTRQGPAVIAGSARIQLKSRQHPDRSFIVGPFDTLRGALEFARALAEDSGPVLSLRVEHRDGRRWKPAWSWGPGREATR